MGAQRVDSRTRAKVGGLRAFPSLLCGNGGPATPAATTRHQPLWGNTGRVSRVTALRVAVVAIAALERGMVYGSDRMSQYRVAVLEQGLPLPEARATSWLIGGAMTP